MIKLLQGDCLEVMDDIQGGAIDMILADVPYGTTACKWDSIIPLEPMWEQLKRVIKPKSAIVMTASQPFTTTLIASNMKMFKYCWVWEKDNATNFLSSKYQPMKKHEDIIVFGQMAITYSKKGNMKYYPQMEVGKAYTQRSGKQKTEKHNAIARSKIEQVITKNKGERFPSTIQKFNRDKSKIHPTQKPVALMEYLIKTYTNEGEVVLDFTMGSGTTGVACQNLGRDFIGIELDKNYFGIAKNRILGGKEDIILSEKKVGITPPEEAYRQKVIALACEKIRKLETFPGK